MKNHQSNKMTTAIFSVFPFLLFGLFYPYDTSTFHSLQYGDVIEVLSDSIITDTIITFDPATMQESISFISRDASVPSIFEKNAKTYQQIKKMGKPGRVDTVFIFDPETKKESMYIIEN